jgi:hypothetical protein
MKKRILLAVLFVCAAVLSAQERAERRRGFYIDTGFGFGGIGYFDGDVKTAADRFSDAADIHFTLDMNLITIGWALTQDLYLVGSIAGIGDSYSYSYRDSNSESKMSLSDVIVEMYAVGARYYPLPVKKYLQLGLDAGISYMSVSQDNKRAESNPGFSGRLSAAYDIDSSMTGFTVLAGGALLASVIERNASVAYTLFVKLGFK